MRTGSVHKKYLGGIEAEIQKIERNNVVCAVVQSDDKVIVDAQSSLDTLMTANYEIGTKNIILEVKSGLIWIPIKIAEKDYRTNASNFTGGFYYNNPTSGSTYRVSGIHYAIINGKEYTVLVDSGSLTFQ